MFLEAYKKALDVILKKPFVLWGLSLMYGLLTVLTMVFTGLIPVVSYIIIYILGAGMAKIYLDGLKYKEVSSEQLFAGFTGKWGRIAGALAWRDLWILIWALVPIVGPILAIIKTYEYRFVPYIVMTRPEITATEALKVSMKETNGKKGDMFLADFLVGIGIPVASFVIMFVARVFAGFPLFGPLFMLVVGLALVAGYIIIFALLPIFMGLYQASFYEMEKPAVPQYYNTGNFGGNVQ